MKTKICTRCELEKPLSEFYKQSHRKDGHSSGCKQCDNASYTVSRNKKKEHYKTVARDRGKITQRKLLEWKSERKCSLCPEADPDCLDLHHLDPNEKDVNIGDVVRYWSWERLTKEINKCIILCSNCHRKVHKGKIKIGV